MKTIFTLAPAVSASSNQRFCVFSHFDSQGHLARYVLHYLRELKQLNYEIIFVSTSHALPEQGIEQLEQLCHTVCLRENVGYDFGSYKAGIQLIRESGFRPTSLLLANDSVFGPILPLANAWDPEIMRDYDLYGMTDSFDHGYHLQSYFLAFSQRLLESDDFHDFWDSVENKASLQSDFKTSIILDYEVGGTKNFLLKGYKIGVRFPFEDILAKRVEKLASQLRQLKTVSNYGDELDVRNLQLNLNASHRYWDTLLDMGFPFIKRELLTKNPTFAAIDSWPQAVSSRGHFDATMIVETLIEMDAIQSIYQIDPTNSIAQLRSPGDVMECELNSIFHANASALGLSLKARFMFDDAYYLRNNPDVKMVVQEGGLPDGLTHFKAHGLREGRVHRFNRQL